jgi:hypothetical protein
MKLKFRRLQARCYRAIHAGDAYDAFQVCSKSWGGAIYRPATDDRFGYWSSLTADSFFEGARNLREAKDILTVLADEGFALHFMGKAPCYYQAIHDGIAYEAFTGYPPGRRLCRHGGRSGDWRIAAYQPPENPIPEWMEPANSLLDAFRLLEQRALGVHS